MVRSLTPHYLLGKSFCETLKTNMKLTICMLVLVGAIAMAAGEDCQSTNDCSHVTCAESDYMVECHNRQCTCTQSHSTNTNMCVAADDCHKHGRHCDRDWHCIDGHCHCGFGFGK